MSMIQMDMEAYSALPHMNQSTLKKGLRSMQHLKAAIEGADRKETDALKFGQLVHTAVLEPESLSMEYAIAPKVDRRTKGGKQEWDDFVRVNFDKTVVKQEDYDRALAIRESVMEHPAAKLLLSRDRETEVTATWNHEGTDCKARLDGYIAPRGKAKPIILDLKTAMDASPDGFSRAVAKFNYHFQQAFYVDAVKAIKKRHAQFIFIAVEKEPPYAVGVYTLGGDAEEVGRKMYKDVLTRWRDVVQSNHAAGYGDSIQEIELPNWAVPEPDLVL
mgnify:CR=1 FL=1